MLCRHYSNNDFYHNHDWNNHYSDYDENMVNALAKYHSYFDFYLNYSLVQSILIHLNLNYWVFSIFWSLVLQHLNTIKCFYFVVFFLNLNYYDYFLTNHYDTIAIRITVDCVNSYTYHLFLKVNYHMSYILVVVISHMDNDLHATKKNNHCNALVITNKDSSHHQLIFKLYYYFIN